MSDLVQFAVIPLTFLVAGCVKGVIGLGLPTVSLALLTIAIDLPSAMALLIVPSLVTNLWQAVTGGHGRIILKRIWPFLSAAAITVWIGALALSRLELSLLSALLGLLLLVYASLNLLGICPAVSRRHERWAGPLFGSVNGILTGMTGSFVVPGVPYLQALGLPRDSLIQAMGMLFTLSTVALAFSLQQNDLLTADIGMTSTLSVIPAIAGMWIGGKVRGRLSAHLFRRIFFLSLGLLGIVIVLSTLR